MLCPICRKNPASAVLFTTVDPCASCKESPPKRHEWITMNFLVDPIPKNMVAWDGSPNQLFVLALAKTYSGFKIKRVATHPASSIHVFVYDESDQAQIIMLNAAQWLNPAYASRYRVVLVEHDL